MNHTMTLGELRALTAHLPDETDLFVDEGDLRFASTGVHMILPPAPDFPYALILEMGQVWNEEYNLDARLDKALGI